MRTHACKVRRCTCGVCVCLHVRGYFVWGTCVCTAGIGVCMCTRGASACMCVYMCGYRCVCACVRAWVGGWGSVPKNSSLALECVSLALQALASASFRKGTTSGRATQPQTEAGLAGGREGEGGQAAGAAGVWGWQCLPHWPPNSSVLPCWGQATTLPLCGHFPKKPVYTLSHLT